MMVVGFLVGVWLIRRLSRSFTPDPRLVTSIALYALLGGVVGARLFYVVHYIEKFRSHPVEVFYIWQGGLELLGGVILAIAVILLCLLYHKLPMRRYFDVLAVGLMMGIVFGRIGCFLYADCYGKPTNLPWGVRFPYNSFIYVSQINPDLKRNRPDPQLKLPKADYLHYVDISGNWHPKPCDYLNAGQKFEVTKGKYRCLPIHPTQLYSSANAALLCLILYLFWRRAQNAVRAGKDENLFTRPGCIFSLMFVLYGITRFFIEFVRDDNPLEFDSLTISQNISIALIVLGVLLLIIFNRRKALKTNIAEP